jgi:hypothetical protein
MQPLRYRLFKPLCQSLFRTPFLHRYTPGRSFSMNTTKTVNFEQIYNASVLNKTIKGDFSSTNGSQSSDSHTPPPNQNSSSNSNQDSSQQNLPTEDGSNFIMVIKMSDDKDKIEHDLNKIQPGVIVKKFLKRNYKLLAYYGIRILTFFVELYKEYIILFWLYFYL